MCVRWYAAIPWALAVGLILASTAGAAEENLVGWWKFDDGAGSLAADSSGNGHDASVFGTPEWGPGAEGRGVALNFTNTRGANAGNFDPTDGKGVFSLAFWCNWDGTGGIQHFLTKSNGWAADTMMFQVEVKGEHSDPARVDRFHLAYQGAPQAVLHVVPANEWAHMVMVFDGTHATGYLNGVDEVGPQPTGIGAPVDGPVWIGVAFNDARVFQGWLDDMRLFSRVLTAAEVMAIMSGDVALASDPDPADGAVDVRCDDGILNWSPGEYAASHDVFLGTAFDDVNDASRADPRDVLVSEGQSAATYDPGRLEFGQTYYWRVDEVNAAPDNTIFKGNVWSFTVEPVAIPIEDVIATSNATSDATSGPARTVDGSGLNANGEHSIDAPDMWLGTASGADPVWIQFAFDRVYKLHEMLLWNYNSAFELVLGFGLKSVTVEYSTDGADWTALGDVELAQATALETYTANTTVDLAGVAARHVRLTVNSGYGMLGQFGLSEVRFLYVPVLAREPQPADGQADVAPDTLLGWRAGRGAAAHEVSLGTAPDALALVDTVDDTALDPGPLDLATAYYWRVDEVNDAGDPSTWVGRVWSFSTQEFVVVDDFESYDDNENRIYETWLDGFVNDTGSTVGYFEAPFAERTITHGGNQSMPLEYDNTGGTTVSEATLAFDASQDWTQHGIRGLLIWFYGNPDNDPAQMYVKVDDDKVPYDGDADNLARTAWHLWYVDLAGMNVADVDELTIGIEGSGAGMVFIDDAMLSPYDRQLVTPTDPGTNGLVAHYAFDGNTSDSTGAHPGTAVGNPPFVDGKTGQAVRLNGTGDYVELTGFKGILGANPITVAAWVKTTNTETGAIIGWGANVATQRFGFRVNEGRLRLEHQGGNVQGDSTVDDGAWHHVAVTVQAGATISYPDVVLWLDGRDDTRATTDPDAFNLTAGPDARIGSRPSADDRFFMGEIDELYIYERALSLAEIAWLAGRMQPFDVPIVAE